MQKDERDLLEVLRFELRFIEDGGYAGSPRTSWRPLHIFEDSPACINYNAGVRRVPCSDCVLMHLVPPERRFKKIPCQHIPFNEAGDTLNSLYRHASQGEIEETVEQWLRSTIRSLEQQRKAAVRDAQKQRDLHPPTLTGTPLYHQKEHPKCANPACPTAFHWTGGGKFFRFRPDPASASASNGIADLPRGIHGVRHYWLCERCSHGFTLVYDQGYGVVLRALWPELVGSETDKNLSVA